MRTKYREAFHTGKEKAVFSFLRKYLRWLENDNEAFNRTVIMTNPLKMKDNRRYNKDFDTSVIQFLYQTIEKSYENKKHSKKYKGEAYAFLGVGYEYGVFTLDENPSKAFESYETSAQLSNPLGTFRLGQCFEKGLGVYPSEENALSFYRCAAKLGLTEALHLFGMVTLNGYLNTMKDENTGCYYLKMAAKKADKLCPYPLFDMGLFYEKGEENCGITADYTFAIEQFENGAKLGDPNCKYKLGQCYEFGDLKCVKNKRKATSYYLDAAKAGQIEAQYLVSDYYLTGKTSVIEKSYKKSFEWARAGATKCSADCAYKCGESAYTGTGTDKNILDAMFWFQISEQLGSTAATDRIKEVEQQIAKENAGVDVPETCCMCLFGY